MCEGIKISDIYRLSGNNKCAYFSVYKLFSDKYGNFPKKKLFHEMYMDETSNRVLDFIPCTFEQLLNAVAVANITIKSTDCPRNIKNRFYHRKHQFIVYCLQNKLVDKVELDTEDLYVFHISGRRFHQPMTYFPLGVHGYDVAEERIMHEGNDAKDAIYYEDVYRYAMIGIICNMSFPRLGDKIRKWYKDVFHMDFDWLKDGLLYKNETK